MKQDRWAVALATCGGIGYAPAGPGTFGSIAGLAAAYAWVHVGGAAPWTLAILAVLLLPVGAGAARAAERRFGAEDPGQVVIDEVAGQWLTLAAARPDQWLDWLLAFVLFRLFDITKPGPIRRLESLGRGYGVIADDLGAGLCAMMILGLYRWLL